MKSKKQSYGERVKERVKLFINEFNDKFDDKTKEVLEKAVKINTMHIKETAHRIIDNKNVTICNGDSHIYNFMLPLSDSSSPLIVDFQFWGEGVGTGDLAHLTRVSFSNELKFEIQLPLVEHSMWQYTGFKINYAEWKDDLQGLIYNFDFLKCEEFLQ